MLINILGAGPHGHEIAHLLATQGHEYSFYDDNLSGYSPLSAIDHDSVAYIIGAAWPMVRKQIHYQIKHKLLAWNDGTIVFPGAIISPQATLSKHVHVAYNAVVSHGCTVGEYGMVCAGAVLGGEVTVEPLVFIGANATVIHGGITIGEGAIVGAGTVVTRDVKPYTVVAGVPAVGIRTLL